MFEETNRAKFSSWIADIVQKSLQNINSVQDYQWASKMKIATFDMLQRLQLCLNLNEQLLVPGLCLVKRLASKDLKITLNSVYKLTVICIFIAQKFYSDYHYQIEDFSIASGITIKEIKRLEAIALNLLDYNLILSERDYYDALFFVKT